MFLVFLFDTAKPGCPRQSGPFGICVHECRSDHECSGNKICCANGCGYQCKEPCPLKKCKAIDCSKHGGFAYSKRGCRECHCGKL